MRGMVQDTAQLTEIDMNGKITGRLRCAPQLIPAPGQYLLAWADQDTFSPLATPLFSAGPCPGGFSLASPLPSAWQPGWQINVRGPLGKGFHLPPAARSVALVVVGQTISRLLPLIDLVLAQRAALVLLTDRVPDGLPAAIEISPLSALAETTRWADYLAIDLPRATLPSFLQTLTGAGYHREGQILVETALPCGGMADCGVCAVSLRQNYQLACKDGPVFDLKTLLS